MTNNKTDLPAGALSADDILPDNTDRAVINGLSVRKGTVAAFVQNAIRWSDPATQASEREDLAREMAASVPALRAVGVFDVFKPHDERLLDIINSN